MSNISINARHMDVPETARGYIEEKLAKLPRIYGNIQSIEVILDKEAEQSIVEIVAHAKKKHTFVARHRDENLHACLDKCLDKIAEQVRRFKDRVRDRQGPSHSEAAEGSV